MGRESYLLHVAIALALFAVAAREAYSIRLYAIETYGKIIHEFDPWFNFRATEYLARHGWEKFKIWFDHESWYPLGRPVGTTIYPGLQIVAVLLWRTLRYFGVQISLNDTCVYFPAWFGVSATVILGLLVWECAGPLAAGVAAFIMAVIPAHLMRSVGGGFDNESLAITTMVATFACWVRATRNDRSWIWGLLAGVAEAAMAAAWGGYVFVVNMVGLHCGLLILLGRYTPGLHKAYSLFWLIGSLGAMQIPVIGQAPIRSLEQVGPLGVFLLLQVLAYCDWEREKRKLNDEDFAKFRWRVLGIVAAAVGAVAFVLLVTGFFGPISVRVRSLFVKHSRTGNPLVDSVAEHQPASAAAYWHYLQQVMFLAPIGFIISAVDRTNANLFLVLYGFVSYYFAQKMNRLIILMGPIASALGGVAVAAMLSWIYDNIISAYPLWTGGAAAAAAKKSSSSSSSSSSSNAAATSAAAAAADKKKKEKGPFDPLIKLYKSPTGITMRGIFSIFLVYLLVVNFSNFYNNSFYYSTQISQPSIMFKTRLNNGEEVIVDDYYVGYKWVKDNTPKDSRILSWWDYGYQIAGIANRTSLADGNTWNLEHIALLGKILTAPQKHAHDLARHLADYVLVWAGGGGDDLAKMPHLARISSSVFDGICPGDPICRNYGFDSRSNATPHPQVKQSLIFNLVMHNRHRDAHLDEKLFKEVYTSKYGLIRVFKILDVDMESKKWLADPANRKCDRPGSWYCPGQYPPKLGLKIPSSHKHIDYDKNQHEK